MIDSIMLVFPIEFLPLIKKNPSPKYPSHGIEILSNGLKFFDSIFKIFIKTTIGSLMIQRKVFQACLNLNYVVLDHLF